MLTLEHMPIETLNLSRKTLNAIRRNGIKTFGDLRKAEQDGNLLELRFIGEKSAKEIRELIAGVLAQPDHFINSANTHETNQTINIYEESLEKSNEISTRSQFSNIKIKKLNLSRQILSALIKNGIETIEELLSVDQFTLRRINRLGPKSIRTIENELRKVLDSPTNYIETKAPEKKDPKTWAEIIEPYLKSEKETRIYTLVSRFGLDIKTLEEIATNMNITRERVRQIQVLVDGRFRNKINMLNSSELLEKTLDIMSKNKESLSLNSFRSTLSEEGILGEFSEAINSKFYKDLDPFEILICYLEILGDHKYTLLPKSYPVKIDELRKAKNLSLKEYKALRNISSKKTRAILRKVAFTGGINLKEAIKILSAPEDITVLVLKRSGLKEIRNQWFSFKTLDINKNRIPLRLAGLKMLAAIPEIDLETFYDGLRRYSGRFYDSIAL